MQARFLFIFVFGVLFNLLYLFDFVICVPSTKYRKYTGSITVSNTREKNVIVTFVKYTPEKNTTAITKTHTKHTEDEERDVKRICCIRYASSANYQYSNSAEQPHPSRVKNGMDGRDENRQHKNRTEIEQCSSSHSSYS